MRKLILLCTALFVGSMCFAQIEKGNIQLGGNVEFTSNDNGGNDYSLITVAPRAGLFLSNTTSLGLQLGYSSISRDLLITGSGTTTESTTSQFLFGTYARFHKSLADNFYLYLQPSLGFGTGKTEVDGTKVADVSSFNIGIAPGLTYFLSPRFALEATWGAINYASTELEGQGVSETNSTFNIGLDLANIGFGLSYYIK